MAKKTQRMEVLGEFRPEDVLSHITRSHERREYKGGDGRLWRVKMWSFVISVRPSKSTA